MKLKTLVTSLALEQIKEVGTVAKQEHASIEQDIECTCKVQWYTILMLSLSIISLVIFVIPKSRKLRLFAGHLFSNIVKIRLFISDTQYYVHIRLCRMAGSIQPFKIMATLTPQNVKLKRNIFWDIIELDWKEVNMTLNGNEINLPTSVTIKYTDTFKIRCIVKR